MTIGGMNEVKVFRRGKTPELIATIPVGELPHGVWPSGDGSRVYVAFENGGAAAAIDTLTNKVIANIPIGQTSQALVYVPNAVPDGSGTQNLLPRGEAANVARLRMEAGGVALPNAHASVAVNSLGLLDLVEVAAAGLAPIAIPGVPCAVRPGAVWQTRTSGDLEDESRWSRNRASHRTSKSAYRRHSRPRWSFAKIPDRDRSE